MVEFEALGDMLGAAMLGVGMLTEGALGAAGADIDSADAFADSGALTEGIEMGALTDIGATEA